MTTPDRRERFVGNLATLMTELRPDWDVAGCVAALRKLPRSLPPAALAFAAIRYADDETNTTPAHIADLGNRAWESFDPSPCRTHPEQRARRTNGECASCFADRCGVAGAPMRDRGGKPIPDDARAVMRAALARRPEPETATAGGS
jgi:hypothetical protein